jgi:hypothetical protein
MLLGHHIASEVINLMLIGGKMKIIIIPFLLSAVLSGCMAFTPSPFQKGSVVLAGDAEGVESLMDGLNGLVANGHTQDSMGDSAHWRHRANQEVQRSKRLGVFQKLTEGGVK